MRHIDFLNDPHGRRFHWHIASWPRAVHAALGRRALLAFHLALGTALLPAVFLAAYAACTRQFAYLPWVLFSLWGFWTKSTHPTGVGLLAGVSLGLAGTFLGAARRDTLCFFAAWLPVATWFVSCALLGATASYLIDALRSSESAFDDLARRGILQARPRDEQADAPQPPP